MGNLIRTTSGTCLPSQSNRPPSSLAQQLEKRAVDLAGKRIADRSRDLGERLKREHKQHKHRTEPYKTGWIESIFKENNNSTPNTGWAKH